MNILDKIAETKREEVSKLRLGRGLASLKAGARSTPMPRAFRSALRRVGRLSLIA